jgi:hypothetical protein
MMRCRTWTPGYRAVLLAAALAVPLTSALAAMSPAGEPLR